MSRIKTYRLPKFAESELDIQAEVAERDDPWYGVVAAYAPVEGKLSVHRENAQEVISGLTELANHCDGYAEDRTLDARTRQEYRWARDGFSSVASKILRDWR